MGWVWFFAGWFGLSAFVILLLWWSNARPFYEPDPAADTESHETAQILAFRPRK